MSARALPPPPAHIKFNVLAARWTLCTFYLPPPRKSVNTNSKQTHKYKIKIERLPKCTNMLFTNTLCMIHPTTPKYRLNKYKYTAQFLSNVFGTC